MGARVLITGASGFIGSFLVQEAINRGYEVWAGVRSTSSLKRLPVDAIHCIDLAYDDPVKLTDQLKKQSAIHGAWDYVVHNAGLTKTTRPAEFFRINAGYTQQLLHALIAADCKPKKFLLMSSLSTYGGGDPQTWQPIRLSDPQKPDTMYGKSKLEAERLLCSQDQIPYVILRPTGVYGPGDPDYGMAIQSVQAGFDFAAGLKPQHITFIYVKDLATVVFKALENDGVRNCSYFVADGDVHTDSGFTALIQELLGKKHLFRVRAPLGLVYTICLGSEWVGRITGKPMTLNTDKYRILRQRNWICEVEPLFRDLAFTPAYRLRDGLKETIEMDYPRKNK